jgi:hypothetical protein
VGTGQTLSHGAALRDARGVHRRILVIFCTQEEARGVGARYLVTKHRELFENTEISLSFDGYIEKRYASSRSPYVFCLEKAKENDYKYRTVNRLVTELASKKQIGVFRTSEFLGKGDAVEFPAEAFASMLFVAGYRGNHAQERVNVDDLIN